VLTDSACCCGPVEEHAAKSSDRIQPVANLLPHRTFEEIFMGLILLEALLALVILIAIVWWTMFSGRKKGELDRRRDED
jgi:hypothetical protein